MAVLSERDRELTHAEHVLIPVPQKKVEEAPRLPALPEAGSFWSRHGEFICAVTAGVLLLAATVIFWGHPAEHKPVAYHVMVGIAFALGFFYGAAEAWEAIREGKLDIHFLMVLGAVLAIFVGSAMEGAILLFLFTLSGALEEYAMQRTHSALESLMKLFPKEAIVLGPDGSQTRVKLEDLKLGDKVLVKPGENVPADGHVVEGSSALDESAITGEYLPREKGVGAQVYAGTMNQSGRLVIHVDKPASDTTLAKIIHLVTQAREEKAPVERLFDKVGTAYTFAVLGVALGGCLVMGGIAGIPWQNIKNEAGEIITYGAFYRAITFVIVASPCALIISTPVVLLSAIASCARRGIVLKGGRHLESLAQLKSMVFDKTGTLTTGKVQLVAIEFIDSRAPLHCDVGEGTGKEPEDEKPETVAAMSPSLKQELNASIMFEEHKLHCGKPEDRKIGCKVLEHGETTPERMLLKMAAALEANSTHPLAMAVMRAAKEQGIVVPKVEEFVQEPGVGLRGSIEGHLAILGSPNLLEGLCHTLTVNRLCDRAREAETAGQTAVVIYYNGISGLLRFQDTVRPDAKNTIDQLHELGVKPLTMLTGDNRRAATAVATALGLDDVKSELLPQDKLTAVDALVKEHKVVAMVGDGINDAPALARATVGIAMGGIGSDAALQAADVVLLSDRIERMPWLIRTSRRARKVMIQNLTFAIGVIVVLAVTTLWRGVPLSLGVIGHEGSTVLVVLNGLRLLMPGKETSGA